MSGANSWGMSNLDADVQETAKEQARKHGLTLGEWLNQAILAHEEAARAAETAPEPGPYVGPSLEGSSSTDSLPGDTRRIAEALERLAERLDASERRQALVVTGLDRAVLGLAARVEDAEAGVRQTSAKVSGAVEEIRRKGEVIGQRVQDAETIAREAAEQAGEQLEQIDAARRTLDARLAEAEQQARRAAEDVGAAVLSQTREAYEGLTTRVAETEALSRDVAAAAAKEIAAAQASLSQRLSAAEAAARAAAEEAVRTVRYEQAALADRVARAEETGRTTVEEARRELQAAQATLQDRLRRAEDSARDAALAAIADVRAEHRALAEKVAAAADDQRVTQALADLQGQQAALSQRFEAVEQVAQRAASAAADEVRQAQQTLESRLEQIEQAARDSAANLRMGAAAAINQVRAAQIDLEKRIKTVETAPPGSGGEQIREAFAKFETRLEKVERGGGDRAALHMLDAKITGLAASLREGRERATQDIEALRARLEGHSPEGADPAIAGRLDQVERTVESAISRLAERLEKAESTANDALRRIEAAPVASGDAEALRAMMEERLEGMAASVAKVVGGMRAEIASKLEAGDTLPDIENALSEVNRRVAASERRQAQTIEAISLEILRMSESIDRRLRTLESRNDDSAAVAVREEVARLATAIEERISGIENREIAGVDRVGAEMGRLAERFDERFDGVERRSAEAIEHIGEQVARMAERQAQRQEQTTRELSERIAESEERQAQRLAETLSTVESKVGAIEERTQSALSPLQKAMSSFSERIQAIEDGGRPATPRGSSLSNLYADAPPPLAEARTFPAAAPEAAVEEPITQSVDQDDIDALAAALRPSPAVEEVNLEEVAEAAEIDPFDQLLPVAPPSGTAQTLAPDLLDTGNDWSAPAYDTPLDSPDFGWDEEEPKAVKTAAAPKQPAPQTFALPEPDEDLDVFEPEAAKPQAQPMPTGKNDYLAAARKAAQANATPQGRKGGPAAAAIASTRKPVEGLKGVHKVVVWGAAGALAMALAGGTYLFTQRGGHPPQASGAQPRPPQPEPAPAPVAEPEAAIDGATELAPGEADPTSIAAAAAEQRAKAAAKKQPQPAPAKPAPRPPQGPQASLDGAMQPVSLSSVGPRGGLTIEQAALRGDAVAQYELGLVRLANAQTPEGIALLRRAANQGLAMAQYRLAKLFERGEGVPADILQARQWTERAAAAGNRKAMHDLGVFYARGEGAPLDEATAFRWFRQAADLGVADSQYNLGILYAQGRGTVANPQEAFFWFLVAARSGDTDARARAASMEAKLTAEQAQQARARASAFTARPASARANGEFGARAWATDSAQASGTPRS